MNSALLDRQQTAHLLAIKLLQTGQALSQPHLPAARHGLRSKKEVLRFKQIMDQAYEHGWKIPEALYAWD